MVMSRKIILRSLLALQLIAGVLPAPAQSNRYQVNHFTDKNGLPSTMINTVIEDNHGYLWIGTVGGGLSRYDGKEFVTFTANDGLYSNTVYNIALDNKGNVWTGHRTGISKFNGNRFKSFEIPNTQQHQFIVGLAAVGDSIIYSGTGNLFGYVVSDSLIQSHPFNRKDSLYVLGGSIAKNRLILLQSNGMLRQLQPNKVTYYEIPGFNLRDKSAPPRLSKYGTKTLFIFLDDKNRFLFDLEKGTFESFQKDYLPIFHDESLNIDFFLAQNNLILHANESGKTDTLIHNVTVNQVIRDKQNIIWMSTSKGLFKITRRKFNLMKASEDPVMGIAVSKEGTIWMGTAFNGLLRIKNGVETRFKDENQKRNQVNQLFRDSKGTLWVATKGGLAKYNEKSDRFDWLKTNDKIPNQWINAISESEEGALWLATVNSGGVYKLNDDQITQYGIKQGLIHPVITVIHASDYYKKTFVGYMGAIGALEDNKVDVINIKALKDVQLTSIDSYNDSIITVGSMGVGLLLYNYKRHSYSIINKSSGLPSDIIYFAKTAPDNSIWIGSQVGFTKLKLTDQLTVESIEHDGESSGLGSAEANQYAYHITRDSILFGTTDGLYIRNQYVPDNYLHPLHLEKVELFFNDTTLYKYATHSGSPFSPPKGVTLPHNQNHLTFYFNQVEKLGAASPKFQYFLENFDKSWSAVTDQHNATYGNIPPGEYRFLVKATNQNGQWSEKPVSYEFTIQPPFYLTRSFLISSAALFITLILVLIRVLAWMRYRKLTQLKEVQLAERERIRKELVKDFHDEVGNYLARIINYVNLLRVNSEHPFSKETLYTKVEETSRKLYTGVRDLIWTIENQNNRFDSLFINLKDFGDQVLSPAINFRAHNDIKSRRLLNDGIAKDILLIYKEAITNVLKHAQASQCVLTIKKSENTIIFQLMDDGVGISPEIIESSSHRSNPNGMGLSNFFERAKRIGGKISIDSELDKGTRITLILNEHSIFKAGTNGNRFLKQREPITK